MTDAAPEVDEEAGTRRFGRLRPWLDNVQAGCLLVTIAALLLGFRAGSSYGLAASASALAALAMGLALARTGALFGMATQRRAGWRALMLAALLMLPYALVPLLPRPDLQSLAAALLTLALAGLLLMALASLLAWHRPEAAARSAWADALITGLVVAALLGAGVLQHLPWQALAGPADWLQPAVQAAALALVVVAALLLLALAADHPGWPAMVAAALGVLAVAGARLAELAGWLATGAFPLAGGMLLGGVALTLAACYEYLQSERWSEGMTPALRSNWLRTAVPVGALCLLLLLLLDGAGWPPAGNSGMLAWVTVPATLLVLLGLGLATGRKAEGRARLARQEAERHFSTLFCNSADVIAIVDGQCRLSFVTVTAERIFGRGPDRLMGVDLASLLSADERVRFRDFIVRELAQPGAAGILEVTVPRGADKARCVEIQGVNRNDIPSIGGCLLNLRDVTERRSMEEQLKRLAFHDPLTLLANRALFRDRAEHALAVARRSRQGVAVLFIDLDNFKKINDSLGHGQGDRVLRTSAQRLVKCTRTGDTVARLGGDEFAVLLESLEGDAAVIEVAERIVEALQEPFAFLGSDLRVAASVGVAFASADDGVEELMRNADVAMYTAKSQGKGRYAMFEQRMHDVAHARLAVEAELTRALSREEFQLHYQPIVELNSGYMLGVEALVRWRHPKRGLVGPAEFIGVAEDAGLMIGLGRWVLRQACNEIRVWQDRLPHGDQVRVAINVSAAQLEQSDLVADVSAALRESGLNPDCLVIEMTESVLMHNTEETLVKLNRLKKLGIRIAIDDFGTGYSSLSYLHRFPIDILKIDRSFVERLGGVTDGAALARTIITLGQSLGLEVVAEGIELEHQRRELIELGCVGGQGYYYSRPALLHELEYSVHMLRRRTLASSLPKKLDFTATGRFLAKPKKDEDDPLTVTGTFGS